MTQSIENTHPEESKSSNKKPSKISQVDDFGMDKLVHEFIY
jgi:hypothetical protein